MKQQCYMAWIYLSWAIYLGGLAYFILRGDYLFALFWLVWLPIVQWAYIRGFPKISRFLGYGRVDDEKAETLSPVPVKVTLYTALGCPFCPLVGQRLEALQNEMGFNLEKVDVTLRTDLLTGKGLRAVPVVEVGKQRLIGHATSNQLAALILAGQKSEAIISKVKFMNNIGE
jgi:glutaredoxin